MKIHLICIGKTDDRYLVEGIEIYAKRLKHYVNFNMTVIPDLKQAKNLSRKEQCEKEGQLILKQIKNQDQVVLLDEGGEMLSSIEYSRFLDQAALRSVPQLVFVIGGPYGFDQAVYERANRKLSLSKMTFSHQMIRLFFLEQIYRAFTISKGEPYHHE